MALQDAEVCDSLDLLSTTQAECQAMSDMGKDILFSRQVWCFMLPKARMPCIAMYEDNEGAILFVVLRNMTEMIRFILGSSIYRGIMCISKLAVDWWKLVGIRRLISGYFSGLETYWMMLFMLRHELSLDSSVIIQYLFYMLSLS